MASKVREKGFAESRTGFRRRDSVSPWMDFGKPDGGSRCCWNAIFFAAT